MNYVDNRGYKLKFSTSYLSDVMLLLNNLTNVTAQFIVTTKSMKLCYSPVNVARSDAALSLVSLLQSRQRSGTVSRTAEPQRKHPGNLPRVVYETCVSEQISQQRISKRWSPKKRGIQKA